MDNESNTTYKYAKQTFQDDIREENLLLKMKIRELEFKLYQIRNFINSVYTATSSTR